MVKGWSEVVRIAVRDLHELGRGVAEPPVAEREGVGNDAIAGPPSPSTVAVTTCLACNDGRTW